MPSCSTTLWALLFLLGWVELPRVYAQQVSLREQCRKGLSGIYLAEFDAADQLKMNLVYLDKKIPDVDQRLSTLRAQLKAAWKKEKESSFDMKIEADRKRLQNLVDSTMVHLDQLRTQRSKQMEDHAAVDLRLKKFQGQLDVLFERTHSTRKKGYPDRIDFKAKCPQFREACVLSTKDAHALLNILELVPSGDVRSSCERYAQQSGVVLEP